MRKIFDVNVVAALGFVQLAWKAWMGEHSGAVVSIASIGGIRSTGETVRVDGGLLATRTAG